MIHLTLFINEESLSLLKQLSDWDFMEITISSGIANIRIGGKFPNGEEITVNLLSDYELFLGGENGRESS